MDTRNLLTNFVCIIICHVILAGPPEPAAPPVCVPSTARPGYVVAVLDMPEGHSAKMIRKKSSPGVYRAFSLQQNGWLVTKRHLAELSGNTLVINYVLRNPDGAQTSEQLEVRISDSDIAEQFTRQPYAGYVLENQPAGTLIDGLEELYEDIGTLPYHCLLGMIGDDADLVEFDPDSGSLRTRADIDRERRAFLFFGLRARCTTGIAYAAVTVWIADLNDNRPQMEDLFYDVTVSAEALRNGQTLLRVRATDADADSISYRIEDSLDFVIDPPTGDIRFAGDCPLLPKSYELMVFAEDASGQRSDPAFVRIQMTGSGRSGFRRRGKRAVRPTKTFVVRQTQQGELFTVAQDYENSANERFQFYSPDPEGLEIDPDTGMVSLSTGFVYNITTLDFNVNVTREFEPGFEDNQPVTMYVVDRMWDDPIFTNKPQEMFVTIPEWIRPDTTIYTVQAIDTLAPYFAPVNYQLEAGGDGCFKIDDVTGEVQVACRRQFVMGRQYRLALSAQNHGAALTDTTPTQTLIIQVGESSPQFYTSYDDVKMSEQTEVGQTVVTIQCVSHQDVQLTYSLHYEDTYSPGVFSINPNTGDVILDKVRVHIQDPHQYRMSVTVTEAFTGLTSTTDLIINLIGANLHSPYFPGTVYPTADNVSEDLPVGEQVMQIQAIDLDQGENGLMTFSVDDPHFRVVSTDGKVAVIEVASPMDYDRNLLRRYDVTLTAVDMGTPPLTGTTQVRIWLADVSDEKPVLDPANQVFRVNQDIAVDSRINIIQAYDPDIGDTISFSFANGSTTIEPYRLDPATGELFITRPIKPSDDTDLAVKVKDDTGRESLGSVVVEVIGVNHAPVFPACSTYTSVTLKEEEPVNTSVVVVTVEDLDPGVNGDLHFEVFSSLPSLKLFVIGNVTDMGNGTWTVNVMSNVIIDRENPTNGYNYVNGQLAYQVTVLAQDDGTPSLATTCFFFVHIEDINDHDPEFDERQYKATILNTINVGDRVIRLFAVDIDEGVNAEFDYAFYDDSQCSGCFALDPDSGWVTRKANGTLTAGTTYPLQVRWQSTNDSGPPTGLLITVVGDPDDLPPTWNPYEGEPIDDVTGLEIQENRTRGVIPWMNFTTNKAGILETTPGATPYQNSEIDFYRITYGETALALTVNAELDYETVPKYSVRIRATQKSTETSPPFTDARAAIQLTDVNDNAPEFVGMDESRTYPAGVSDQTKRGDDVVKVIAIDEDGTPEHNTVTYYFSDLCGVYCTNFTLDGTTGQIKANSTYSPEWMPQYFLVVVGTDNSPSPVNNERPLSATATVRVEVTGTITNSPYFDNDVVTVEVKSGVALNTTVHTLEAIDPTDQSVMQYYIVSGDPGRDFAVNIATGDIYTVHEILYERNPVYNLTCAVFDGLRWSETLVNIRVTEQNVHPPTFVPRRLYVVQNRTAEDVPDKLPLVNVSAVDPEGDTSLSYSVEGRHVEAGHFTIEGTTVYKTTSLDRDYPFGHDPWVITVAVEESTANPEPLSGYSVLEVYPIDVNDNAPFFDTCCLVGNISEGATKGTAVLQLVAIDYDQGNKLTYGPVQIPENDFGQKLFTVGSDGLVRSDVDGSEFNVSVTPRYQAVVFVTDGKFTTNQTIDIVVVDTNNNPPVFDASSFQFEEAENRSVGSRVGAVYATDRDTAPANARLRFDIVDAVPYFYMDSLQLAQAGVIRIAEVLDYENSAIPKTFALTVTVTDGVGTSSTSVSIVVTDVNDNAPVISPVNQIALEEGKLSYDFVTFTAHDADTGTAGEFYFDIDYERSDPDRKFVIDPQGGNVSLNGALDWETTPMYNISVLAVDKGSPALTGTTTLSVSVINLDDSPPRGTFEPPYPVVGGSTLIGAEVARIIVTDTDSPILDTSVTYDCNEPFCQDFTFEYTPSTGIGIISAARDGYNILQLGFTYYTLGFSLADKSGNSVRQTVRIGIQISNADPISGGQSTVYVYNYMASLPDTDVGRVYCDNPEGWNPQDKTFTTQVSYAYFNVSSVNGTITMKRGTPRGEHVLDVQVYDNIHQVSVVCSVNIFIYYVYADAVEASGSIRISGTTPEEFILRAVDANGNLLSSKYDLLQQEVASLVGVAVGDVVMFTVGSGSPDTVDVVYAVRNSYGTYYRPSKINGLVWINKETLNAVIGCTIVYSPISLCTDDSCFGTGCSTLLDVVGDALPVITDQTSVIGINAFMKQECVCPGTPYTIEPPKCQYYSCANNGTCEEYYNGYRCACLEGFDGQHCEQTKLSFTPGGWAWFNHLPACDVMKISLDVATLSANGLLLYNGPMFSKALTSNKDYLAIQLVAGYPVVKLDVGNGELTLTLDGRSENGSLVMDPLSDAQWHTIELFKNNTEFSLVVDHCQSVAVTETLEYSQSDRTPCQVTKSSAGLYNLINVYTPLELGGRANATIDYPTGIADNTLDGCIRNVWINGMLYDLYVGDIGEGIRTEEQCPREGCQVCLGNSTCSGPIDGSNPVCTCLPGYSGANCESEAPLGDFLTDTSYVEWELLPNINATYGSDSFKISQLSLQFRTRQPEGVIFETHSFSTLERMILQVVTSNLEFRYDLGQGDIVIWLPYVNVSDGAWHTVVIRRYGDQAILWLDGAEGKYQTEMWPFTGFQNMVLASRGTYGAAHLRINPYSQEVTVSTALAESCIRDVRLNEQWIPMFQDQNSLSDVADVIDFSGMDDLCESDACAGVVCPPDLVCEDVWREFACICPPGMWFGPGDVCVPISDCSVERCVWGDCVMVTDPDNPDELIWRCNCDVGWTGVYCNETSVLVSAQATVSTGWMSAVAAALLLLLILLLIVVCCTKKRKAGLLDEPDFAKEFVMDYDEDGGGEEDMQAYDLRPLQKPVAVERSLDTPRIPLVEELPRMAPDPLHAERPPVVLPSRRPDGSPDVETFITGRLADADVDPSSPPYDSVRQYEYEGEGSLADTLSSIQTSSSDRDQDMDFLLSFGEPFRRLADLYLADDEDDVDDAPRDDVRSGGQAMRPRVVEETDISRDIAQDLAYKRALAAEELRRAESEREAMRSLRRQDGFGIDDGQAAYERRLADEREEGLVRGAWEEDDQRGLIREETGASLEEPLAARGVVEEVIQPERAVELRYPESGVVDRDSRTLDVDGRLVERQDVVRGYEDVASEQPPAIGAGYADGATGLEMGYRDAPIVSSYQTQEAHRTVKTSRIVRQTATEHVTSEREIVGGYFDEEADAGRQQGEGRSDGAPELHAAPASVHGAVQLADYTQAPPGSGLDADYTQAPPGGNFDADYTQAPPGGSFEADSMVSASARVVKTEHVSWTQNKQIRRFDDYSEV